MEWQPIGTAPKDGTKVIVYNSVTGPYMSIYDNVGDHWPMFGWDTTFGVWYPVPSHWMRLPEPPNE